MAEAVNEGTPLLAEYTRDTYNGKDSSEETIRGQTTDPTDTLATEILPGNTSHSIDSVLKVYKRRWYILFLFASLAFLQSGLCNVWTVIAESVHVAFGWSDSTISLMQNWFYVMYLVSIFPFTWMIEVKGLRLSMLITSALVFIATVFRCVSMTPPAVTWLNNIGNGLLGLAGPVCFACGPVVSSLWFPPEQRSTATAIATISGFAGSAVCFLIGPSFVSAPIAVISESGNSQNYSNIDAMRREIREVRAIESAICGVLFLLLLVYFPSKPPKPPSRSAALPKLNFFHGIRGLFRRDSVNFWLVCFTYSISTGIYGVWIGLLAVFLKGQMEQDVIGWLGFSGTMVGSVAAVLFGRVADCLTGRMKFMSMWLVSGLAFSSLWVVLLIEGYIPFSYVELFIAVVIQGLCNYAPIPLYYEMAIESNYPIDEIVTSGMLSIMYNVFPIVFLGLFFIPNIGTGWMTWCMYVCMVVCSPLLYFFTEKFKRLNVDRRPQPIITIVQ